MRIIPQSAEAIADAVSTLKNGGVVAHATETCYGLACDLSNVHAVQKLFAVKERPFDQPVSALFSSVEQAKQYVEWNTLAEELAAKHLPGPLTLILRMRKDAPTIIFPIASGESETVGVRISSHPTAQRLAELVGSPISTTSANIHSQPNPYSCKEIQQQLLGRKVLPDLILDDGSLPKTDASTILDVSDGKMVIVRRGPLTFL